MSSPILQQIRRLVEDQRMKDSSDEELLRQFSVSRDEAGFHALLRRHGPMVMDVCRAVLHNEADAEDAFQATFLILARKAGSIRKTAALGSWLHGVAYRTALQAQTEFARRRKHENRVPMREASAPEDLTWCEVQRVLHEELSQLAERHRSPLVLCYLEGKTQDEAAALLGLAKGTLKGRLERGRALLRERLVQRGLGPAAVLLASAWPAATASAVVPTAVLSSTVQAASLIAAGQALPAGILSAQAVSLAKGAVQTMTVTKLVFVMLLMLAVGGVGIGFAVFGPGEGRAVSASSVGQQGEASPDSLPAEKRRVIPQVKVERDPPAGQVMQVTLASSRKEYRVGEAVDLIVTVKNNGKEAFSYAHYKLQDLYDFTMIGADGNEVKRMLNPVEIEFASTLIKVPPGQAVVVKDGLQGVNLPKAGTNRYLRHAFYPMETPGVYRLRIRVGEARSNELKVKVLRREGEAEPAAQTQDGDAAGFGPEVKGLRARITLAKQKFVIGEPIDVKYVVKNVSKVEQVLWHSGFWANHLVLVRDADGKELPLNWTGERQRQAFSPGGERGKNVPWPLPSGEVDAAEGNYDLTSFYFLTRPGKYTVQYIYEEKQGRWEGRLPSNTVSFELVATGTCPEERVEKDGVHFEVLAPDRTWPIPKNQPGIQAPVNLGLRISNKTNKPLRFSRFDTLWVEMVRPDGKSLRRGGGRDGTFGKVEADCPLVKPGESVTFIIDAALFWQGNELRLSGSDGFGGLWLLHDLKPGPYKVRVRYQNDRPAFETSPPRQAVLDGVWTGEVDTPFVEVTLSNPPNEAR